MKSEIDAASATSTDPTKISESEHMTKAVPTQRSNPINETGIGLHYHVTVMHIIFKLYDRGKVLEVVLLLLL